MKRAVSHLFIAMCYFTILLLALILFAGCEKKDMSTIQFDEGVDK